MNLNIREPDGFHKRLILDMFYPDTNLEKIGLNIRTLFILKKNNIETVGQLANTPLVDIMRLEHMTESTLTDIINHTGYKNGKNLDVKTMILMYKQEDKWHCREFSTMSEVLAHIKKRNLQDNPDLMILTPEHLKHAIWLNKDPEDPQNRVY